MADESYNFSTTRARLEEIVSQVRKKDTTLEKSLDLLEEGVRLANQCTELIDQQDWATGAAATAHGDTSAGEAADATPGAVVIEDVAVTGEDGEVLAEVVEVTEYEAIAGEPADAETASATEFVDAEEAWADDAWADESETVAAEEPDEPSADEG